MQTTTLTAYVSWNEESCAFYGVVPGVHGAHTQGATLEELQANLKEVLELCAEEGDLVAGDVPSFVGLQQIEIAI